MPPERLCTVKNAAPATKFAELEESLTLRRPMVAPAVVHLPRNHPFARLSPARARFVAGDRVEWNEEGVYPRVSMPRGVSSTVTMLIRYGVISLGFLLGLAIAGIPIDRIAIVTIETFDGTEVIVPNGMDPERVSLLRNAAKGQPGVLGDPEPWALFRVA